VAWILDAVGCSFSCREGSAGPPLKNVMETFKVKILHFNYYGWCGVANEQMKGCRPVPAVVTPI
jgi:hypothetical protein